jgi:hypothetical protein
MKTPFTHEQFMEVLRNYNTSVWPIQIVFYLLGILALILLIRKNKFSDRLIFSILTCYWLWIGIVYQLMFFTTINKAAYFFSFIFILQGIIFLFIGVLRPSVSFEYKKDMYGIMGWIFVIYALIIYPILGYGLGHVYPNSPTFGLPCPTTIFTFGLLLFVSTRISYMVLILPVLWSIIGFFASLLFGIYEDIGLLLAGLIGTALLFVKNRGFSVLQLST